MRKIGILILISCITCCIGLSACGKNNTANTTNAATGSEIKQTEYTGVTKDIYEMAQRMKKNGAYIQLAVSEDQNDNIAMFYNNQGDCYSERGDGISVYYDNKGHARIFTATYQDVIDLNPLMFIETFAKAANAGIATVEDKGELALQDKYEETLKNVKAERSSEASTEESTETTVTSDNNGISTKTETFGNTEDKDNKESELSDEDLAAYYIGFPKDQIKDLKYHEVKLVIKGYDNIKKAVALELTNKSDVDEFMKSIDTGNENKDTISLILTVRYNNDEKLIGKLDGASLSTSDDGTENTESLVWYFNQYYPIGGDWPGFGDDLFTAKLEPEEIKTRVTNTTNMIMMNINNYLSNNFSDDELNMLKDAGVNEDSDSNEEIINPETEESTEESTSESTEESISESTEESKKIENINSIVKQGSFKETIDNTLKADGLENVDPMSFDLPDGYTEEDRTRMLDIYNKLIEWDAKQSNGTLISPISPDDVDFSTKYIDKCQSLFSSSTDNTDRWGAIYWKNTVGIFLEAIK